MLIKTICAYIDPATTSYLIQIVAGVAIACAAGVGIFWRKITMWFRSQKLKRIENKLKKQQRDNDK